MEDKADARRNRVPRGVRATKLIVDSHEPKFVPEVFIEAGFDVEVLELTTSDGTQVGDILGEGFVVERKTEDDFWSSLVDGRLYKQIEKMARYFPNYWKVIILEGYLSNIAMKHNQKKWIRSIRWEAKLWGVDLVQVDDLYGLVEEVSSIINKVGKEPKVRLSKIKLPRNIPEQVKFLSCLPGIGETRAKRILEACGTPIDFIMDLIEDPAKLVGKLRLAKVGVGKETIEKIEQLLTTYYAN